MPAPIATYQTLRFLWNESKPVRDWLWSKLPSVKDTKRREAAEERLAKLLDDANALAQALPHDDLDPKIDERIERFRQDLRDAKFPPEEADLLTERASMFVRLLVTGPFADVVALRTRLADVEREMSALDKRLAEAERELKRNEETVHRFLEGYARNQRTMLSILVVTALVVIGLFAAMLLRR